MPRKAKAVIADVELTSATVSTVEDVNGQTTSVVVETKAKESFIRPITSLITDEDIGLLTNKGNSLASLLNINIANGYFTMSLPAKEYYGEVDHCDAFAIADYQDKIPYWIHQDSKMGVGKLKLSLERIEHHRDQLIDAFMALRKTYRYMTSGKDVAPKVNVDQVMYDTKHAMLMAMPDVARIGWGTTLGVDPDLPKSEHIVAMIAQGA